LGWNFWQPLIAPLNASPIHRFDAAVYRDTRRTFLRRFPYVVFHVMRSDRVHVLAVLNQRRNPRIARNRVSRFEGG
jgi:plasmid stabilization system protein ParE